MIFEILLANVLPLYGLIIIGFLIGRYAKLEVEPIATLMIYGLIPIVMFGATAKMELLKEHILPAFIIGAISLSASILAYYFAKRIWPDDNRANLLAMLGVSSNATYFGIPIAIAMTDKSWLGVYMLMLIPLFILDASLGVFFAARGQFSVKQSLINVAKLPIIYGAISGLIYNMIGLTLAPLLVVYWERFTGSVIIVGMMLIGAGLAKIDKTAFDKTFFIAVAILRYLVWPALGLLFIALDVFIFKLFQETIYTFIVLICSCPLAANNVAYAAKFKLQPTLTATVVMISSLLAIGFIPLLFWVKSLVF
jgi:predicted permease